MDTAARPGINDITGAIVDSAMRIHTRFGPGLFESVYEAILARDLRRLGFTVERQRTISFEFEGMYFPSAGRADLFVERSVIVEVKSVVDLPRVVHRQVLTYLHLLDCPVGLVLNFGVLHMRDGVKRIANRNLPPDQRFRDRTDTRSDFGL